MFFSTKRLLAILLTFYYTTTSAPFLFSNATIIPPLSLYPLSRRICPVILPAATPPPLAAHYNSPITLWPLDGWQNLTSYKHVRSDTTRIVGSIAALPTIRAFLVSLSHPNNSFACTGTLLSKRWVLTAAHCGATPDWILRVGLERADSGVAIPIKRVIPHTKVETARLDQPGDLALVELASDAHTASASPQLVAVNTEMRHPEPGAFARAAGYGRVETLEPANPPFANQVDAPVNDDRKCSAIYEGVHNISKSYFICAGYDQARCRAVPCNGDSGGPLLQYDAAGSPVLIGVASFGFECGARGIPSVFVRISAFTSWMRDVGADFQIASPAIQKFADGSDEARNPEASVSVATADSSLDDGKEVVVVPRITFAVICAIAAVAVVAFTVLSVTSICRAVCNNSRTDIRSPVLPDAPPHVASHPSLRPTRDVRNSPSTDNPLSSPLRSSRNTASDDESFTGSLHTALSSLQDLSWRIAARDEFARVRKPPNSGNIHKHPCVISEGDVKEEGKG